MEELWLEDCKLCLEIGEEPQSFEDFCSSMEENKAMEASSIAESTLLG